ncbi:enoyl CoA hydratase [Scheffersomyces stipitis CBS 6054]|uniref:Enoyl CoA hydratase n=1 Tax=Scheffersomyces stipitis (strain ATCC 58785 / CBS 6054 / NBRC 10063 / NRRL Y-11545) TaxID=322104 RepID=A3LQ56_PICST|nr:enoyl CoA hydratase [Scheffersomyces stipitis CBS 6054]ABN64617.1 enoyl CoA hydratase [Scheffersomyces stipitis CBS 6054]KAG2736373.1 hypothetical protein G9P44_000463 [Scheffersomyces stipitis]
MTFNADDFKQFKNFIVSEIEEGFVHIQFNNPKTLNAFADQDWKDYYEILVRLDADPETNVILISSTVPKAFSSGLNLKDALATMSSAGEGHDTIRFKKLHDHIADFQYCIGTPARINTPTIALLNGINYGLALDIAAATTIRVATADARFSIREIKIGISADIGSLQRMPNIVNNKSLLFQHALTGDVFKADEALNLGFVSKIVADIPAGLEYCKELGSDINGHQQWAIKGTKKHIQDIIDNKPVEEGLKDIRNYNATHINGKFLEGIRAVKL